MQTPQGNLIAIFGEGGGRVILKKKKVELKQKTIQSLRNYFLSKSVFLKLRWLLKLAYKLKAYYGI